jgi:predicted RNase H-like HicB family nuclease
MRYAVVIEKAGKGYSAHVPDLPVCVAAGASVASVKAALAEVIPFHLEGLRDRREAVPAAGTMVEWVKVWQRYYSRVGCTHPTARSGRN